MMTAAPHKKCILVTGPPGVGKTTLITRVVDKLRNDNPQLKVQGFYTREIRHANDRTGFEVVTVDGRTSILASSTLVSGESAMWPNVGKYKVDVAGFESLALPELQIKEGTGLYVIDEVGKMELFSSSFFPAVLRVLNSNIPVLASIPIPKFGRDIPEDLICDEALWNDVFVSDLQEDGVSFPLQNPIGVSVAKGEINTRQKFTISKTSLPQILPSLDLWQVLEIAWMQLYTNSTKVTETESQNKFLLLYLLYVARNKL